MDQQSTEMGFPLKGLDVSAGFDTQPQQTTPVAMNVRTFEPGTGRAKGGARAGLARYINEQVGGLTSPIQHLNIIVDPTVDALLDNFDYDGFDGVEDPSTRGGVGRGRGRLIRPGGTGNQPSKNKKKLPRITWSDPADIYEYTPLTGTQLNAVATDPDTGATVSGTFTYSPAHGRRLPVGNNQPLDTTFAPDDTATYKTLRDTPVRVFVAAVPKRLNPDGSVVGKFQTVNLQSPNRKRVHINVLPSDVGAITSVTFHGLITAFVGATTSVTVAAVKMSVNGGADITIGASGVLALLHDVGIVGQDTEIRWPGTYPAVPEPWGYYFTSS